MFDQELNGAAGTLRLIPLQVREGGSAMTYVYEGERYKYRVLDAQADVVDIEPRELFEIDPDSHATGRFMPRDCVGALGVRIRFADGAVGTTDVDVRPTKLSYETSYRNMLDQIAEQAAEALLHGFAPASRAVHMDPTKRGDLRYRSLAFLISRFRQPGFDAAVQMLRARPDRSWTKETTERRLGSGTPTRSNLVRSLQRRGPQVPVPAHLRWLPFSRLSGRVEVDRFESAYNTPANRFVRFALTRWQGLALDLLSDLRRHPDTEPGPRRRGRMEAEWVVAYCDEVLASPPLREAGRLTTFPVGNQVLLRQAGYRDILRMFALTEATISLDAVLPDDPFSATQRNVSTLYEYWCFIVLVRAMTTIAGGSAEGAIFEQSADGLRLVLKQGKASRLTWELEVGGRQLLVELWFNRTFAPRASWQAAGDGSWSRQLRPDASVRVRPRTGRPDGLQDPHLDVWLHFDAKYSIESMAVDETVTDGDTGSAAVRARREHILKMHAYRDAIRRSAGAYVLYPGHGEQQLQSEFHEILPGLGAFAIRPESEGGIEGLDQLEKFLSEVLSHVANQASARERSRFWSTVSHRGPGPRVRAVDFLARPPADTPVLVGYARDPQVEWVVRVGLYNVRAGNRGGAVMVDDGILKANHLVLWGGPPDEPPAIHGVFRRDSPWQLMTAHDLAEKGYPVRAADAIYFVTEIVPLGNDATALVSPESISSARPEPYGSPFSMTWEQLTADAPAATT